MTDGKPETTNRSCIAAVYAGLRVGLNLAQSSDDIRSLSNAVEAMNKLERELTEDVPGE